MKRKYFVTALILMTFGVLAGVPAQSSFNNFPGVGWIFNASATSNTVFATNNAVVTVNEGQTATNNGMFDNLADGFSAGSSAGTVTTTAVPVKLNAPFNTGSYEAFLRFSADGLRAYFSAVRAGGLGLQDIYMTERAGLNAPWGNAVNLGPAFNTSARDYLGVESPDGLTLYFDRNEGDLAKAVRPSISTPWTHPSVVVSAAEFVNINVANSLDYHPTLTPDGLTLIFQNNAPSGLTLKISTRANTSAPWSAPVPLSNINSGTLTNNPLLTPDGLTLYFCSNRAGGLGGTDLYKAVRANSSVPWTHPSVVISAIPEANSAADDASPFVGQNTSLYFSSNRDGDAEDYADYYLENQWSWSLITDDSAADSQTVTVTATDGNGSAASESFDLIVNNVAPMAVLTNGGGVSPGTPGSVSFSNQFDPSAQTRRRAFATPMTSITTARSKSATELTAARPRAPRPACRRFS
jgi:hypothetical protein